MKKLMTICVVVMVMLLISPANANVLMFDDIINYVGYTSIPNGYGGFNWDNNFMVVHRNFHPGSGYDLGCVSPDYVAFNAYTAPVFLSDGAFTFNGAYLTSAWTDSMGVRVEGYSGGSLLYDTTVPVVNTGPTWYNFDYVGIDELHFSSVGGDQFAMDNFTYNQNVIPAPGAILLGSIGVGLVGWLRRRRTL